MEKIKINKIKSRIKNYTRQENILLPIFHFILFLLVLWTLLPFAFTFMNSFKDVVEYNRDANSFPTYIQWENYLEAWKLEYRNTNVIGLFFNTVIFVATFSVANICSSLFVAYALSRFKFLGNTLLYSLAITIQIIPIFGNVGASYLLCDRLGLVDNILFLWVTAASGFDYAFLILFSYFVNVDRAYSDAAKIDGAGNWTIFLKIMVPMVMPAILTLWLTIVIGLWNNYTTPLIFLPTTPTLSTGLYALKSRAAYMEGGITSYFAVLVLSIIPLLLLYSFTQRKLFKVDVEGGLKG